MSPLNWSNQIIIGYELPSKLDDLKYTYKTKGNNNWTTARDKEIRKLDQNKFAKFNSED